MSNWAIWIALAFVPLAAWSRDLAVVTLAIGAAMVLMQAEARRGIASAITSPAGFLAGVFTVWSATAVLWSPHMPWDAWAKAFLAIGLGAVLATGLTRVRHALIKPVLTAALALFAVLMLERLTGGFFIGLDRADEPGPVRLNALNGGLVLLGCAAFPLAALLYQGGESWRASALFVLAVFGLSLTYRMDAVPAALIAGGVSFALVLRWRAPMLVGIATVVAVLAVGWAALAANAPAVNLQSWFAENIHPNWGYRIGIWARASELIRDSFLIGHGFDSARVVGEAAGLAPGPDGKTTFLHPHNGMIQIWLELGLVGVALLLATTAALLRRALLCKPDTIALAATAGAMSTASTIWLLSFGVWQGWWLAVLGLTASVTALVFRPQKAL